MTDSYISMLSHVFLTTSECSLSYPIPKHFGPHLHLYLTLYA